MTGWVQYNWTMEYIEQFDVENKTYSYPVSALQSMLSQVVLLSRYSQELQKTSDAEDMNSFYYLLGRIFRKLAIVEPLVIEQYVEDDELIDDIFKQTTPIKLTSPSKPRLKGKPNYLGPEQMNWFYIIMFIIEGFGAQTLGFMSTYYAAECGYLGWS